MDSRQWPSIVIPRRMWRISDVGYSETLGSRCYLVLTQDYFGWRSNFLPDFTLLFASPEFQAIPLAVIERVVLAVSLPGHSALLSIHCTDCAEPLEFSIRFPYRWVTVLQRSGLAVVGADDFRLASVKGFLLNYGYMAGFAACSAFWLVSTAYLTLARVRAADYFMYGGFVLLAMLNAIVFTVLHWWKCQQTRVKSEERSKSAPALFESNTPRSRLGSPERNEE